MCMKMFFSLVNNIDKSVMFSEKSKYLQPSKTYLFLLITIFLDFSNSAVDEHQCLNISSKCCFLLTAVRGMHSDSSSPNKHLLKEYVHNYSDYLMIII